MSKINWQNLKYDLYQRLHEAFLLPLSLWLPHIIGENESWEFWYWLSGEGNDDYEFTVTPWFRFGQFMRFMKYTSSDRMITDFVLWKKDPKGYYENKKAAILTTPRKSDFWSCNCEDSCN